MAGNVNLHLSVTPEAAEVLQRSAGKRGRGALVSRLLVEYDRRQQASEDRRLLDALMDAIRAQAVEQSQSQPQVQSRRRRRK